MADALWTEPDQQAQKARLDQVVRTVEDLTRRQLSSVVIFDLDGTLLDNRPRTFRILREIAANHYATTPQLQDAIYAAEDVDKVAYSVRETLANLGVTSEAEVELVEREWRRRFFSDFHQHYDLPVRGGRELVDDIYQAGATICYLTGRDVSMLVGTTESLRRFGFPIGIVGTMTVVKSDLALDDETFKKDTVAYLKRLGSVVATFENEPGNANMLQREFPYADTFLLLTQHRPDAPQANEGIVRIKDFSRVGPS